MASPAPGDARGNFEHLLRQARAGSREALGGLLGPFIPALSRWAAREVPAALRAKGSGADLAQMTLLEAHIDFADFRGNAPEELVSWLRSVLHHNGQNFRRRFLRYEKHHVGREVPFDHRGASRGLRARLPATGVYYDSDFARREEAEALYRAVERLPALPRRVVCLRGYDGLRFREVGAEVGCSAEAARKVWSRALEVLRSALGGGCGESA